MPAVPKLIKCSCIWQATSVDQVCDEVSDWYQFGEIISDEVAQTIAMWWHSPGEPNSTMLSNRGAVTDDMSIRDFASVTEYYNALKTDRDELDALEAYIKSKQGE